MLQGYGLIYSIYILAQIQTMNKIIVSLGLKLRKTDDTPSSHKVSASLRCSLNSYLIHMEHFLSHIVSKLKIICQHYISI